jgi:16S rRNA (guanine1207-N2)-methyltransferase
MPRPAEERALQVATDIAGQRVLGVTLGRARALTAIATQRPDATVLCWVRDQFRASQIETSPPNFEVACAADPPPDLQGTPIDLAVLPFTMHGEAELTRETLQEAAHRLELGGTLVASTDNPRDTWLRQQLEAITGGVRAHNFADAVVYSATKREPLRRRRDFSCEFVYRDGERLLRALTRPGVFSHRHVDPGARQLLAAAAVGPGERVLDIGCGAGTIAIALAAREPTATVHAVDSDTRAVACVRRGAELNGLTNLTVELNAFGGYEGSGSYDLVVTNPPYYADFQIAARMTDAAHQSLRPRGRMLVVTKAPEWYPERLASRLWRSVEITPSKRYSIVSATRV